MQPGSTIVGRSNQRKPMEKDARLSGLGESLATRDLAQVSASQDCNAHSQLLQHVASGCIADPCLAPRATKTRITNTRLAISIPKARKLIFRAPSTVTCCFILLLSF